MKTITVIETYYELPELYAVAASSRPRRDLLGYMLKNGYLYDTAFHGAMHLVADLEAVQDEVYHLELQGNFTEGMVGFAELAMAGGLRAFTIPKREILRTARAISKQESRRVGIR